MAYDWKQHNRLRDAGYEDAEVYAMLTSPGVGIGKGGAVYNLPTGYAAPRGDTNAIFVCVYCGTHNCGARCGSCGAPR